MIPAGERIVGGIAIAMILGALLLASACLGARLPVTEYGHPEVYATWSFERQECVLHVLIYDAARFSTGVGGGVFPVDASWCGR